MPEWLMLKAFAWTSRYAVVLDQSEQSVTLPIGKEDKLEYSFHNSG